MIPLIGSLCYGPSGLCHLPRFWWKVLLRKKGILDEEYPDCSGGLDSFILDRLALDKEETLAYIRDHLPDYLTFEDWVIQKKGGAIDPSVREEWTDYIHNRKHTRAEKIDETYGDIGWDKDKVHIDSAVILNSVQDWQLFYKRDLDLDYAWFGREVPPLLSTVDYGPIGACQLPRTWYKITMRARNLLHPDYPDLNKKGLDGGVLDVLNIRHDDAVAYIRKEVPDYVQFEAWILDRNDGQLDNEAISAWNDRILNRVHNDAKQAEIRAFVGRPDSESLTSGVVLNHIEDWRYAHNQLIANT